VLERALEDAGMEAEELDGVAATTNPGLIGALLIGLTAAKAVSWALERPLLAINHLHAHIYATWMDRAARGASVEGGEPPLPAVSMVVSGGHTSLYLTRGPLDHELLGSTVDDAAGEAFDKVANILHLGYPGGPAIEKAAREGDPRAVDFPRSWLKEGSADFSFSGLKTAVLYHCVGPNASKQDIEDSEYAPQFVADVAASFQAAVLDVLAGKVCQTAERERARSIIVGGGVAANGRLRERLRRQAEQRGIELRLAPRKMCTDNAAMVAGLAYHMLKSGRIAPLTVEAQP
jgi:N6-L-threonylcarbamoyladenine synthase